MKHLSEQEVYIQDFYCKKLNTKSSDILGVESSPIRPKILSDFVSFSSSLDLACIFFFRLLEMPRQQEMTTLVDLASTWTYSLTIR